MYKILGALAFLETGRKPLAVEVDSFAECLVSLKHNASYPEALENKCPEVLVP